MIGCIIEVVRGEGLFIDGGKCIFKTARLPLQSQHFQQSGVKFFLFSVIDFFFKIVDLGQKHLIHEAVDQGLDSGVEWFESSALLIVNGLKVCF